MGILNKFTNKPAAGDASIAEASATLQPPPAPAPSSSPVSSGDTQVGNSNSSGSSNGASDTPHPAGSVVTTTTTTTTTTTYPSQPGSEKPAVTTSTSPQPSPGTQQNTHRTPAGRPIPEPAHSTHRRSLSNGAAPPSNPSSPAVAVPADAPAVPVSRYNQEQQQQQAAKVNFSRPKHLPPDLKSAAKGLHGAGDALRGSINGALAKSVGDREELGKQRGIREMGVREMESAGVVRRDEAPAVVVAAEEGGDGRGREGFMGGEGLDAADDEAAAEGGTVQQVQERARKMRNKLRRRSGSASLGQRPLETVAEVRGVGA